MLNVHIIESNHEYDGMFLRRGWKLVDSIAEADLVQFTGGADVTPALYGEENTSSYNDVDRDLKEVCLFREALAMGLPMAGICRGGQFLNVMSGGKMIQDVKGHAVFGTHKAWDHVGDRELNVTSTHHQMMVPHKIGQVLLTADIVDEGDTEAVFYNHTQALCFQPHPEFLQAPTECTNLYFEYLEHLFDL